MPIRIWLVDDASQHHAAARATIADLPAFELESFHDGGSAVVEFTRRARECPEELPRVILMDFYMGEMRGDETTQAIRAVDPVAFSPVIVGYSSVASGSAAIVEAGGNIVVRKRIGPGGTNPELRVYLESFMRIADR